MSIENCDKLINEIAKLLTEYFSRDIALYEEIEMLLFDLYTQLPFERKTDKIREEIIKLSDMLDPKVFNNGLRYRIKVLDAAQNINSRITLFKIEGFDE
jgi:hypothetical protein